MKSLDTYINTFDDVSLIDAVIASGDEVATEGFSLRQHGRGGTFGLYIQFEGPGTLNVYQETDPGEETVEPPDREHEWFRPEYGNPVKEGLEAGNRAIPSTTVIGQHTRFILKAVGGQVTVTRFRLVIQ